MPDETQLLSDLAEDFSARLRAGENVDVEEYADLHPEIAERIRALFPTLAVLQDCNSRAPTREKRLAAGQRLGEYEIVSEIGRGGMGIVYSAVHSTLGKRVAVKSLRMAWSEAGDELRERFFREARTAASLHHTNIVPVFDVGEDHGVPYFAMEYIDGRGLDSVIDDLREAGSPRRPPEAESLESSGASRTPRDRTQAFFRWGARIGVQAAEALYHAHQRGVIHRDVKPSNLLLDRRGNVWLTDLGLARGLNDPALTQSGALLGTPRYMSPEQAKGDLDSVDHRSDVFSLGVTLYELLTRQPAFAGETTAGILQRIVHTEPIRPRVHDAAIPVDLETILLKAIAKRPEDRYASARDLADDLGRFLRGEPVLARPIGPFGRTVRWCRRNPQLTLVSLVAVVAILIICAVDYVRIRSENAKTEAALTTAQVHLSELFMEKYKRSLEDHSLQQAAIYAAAALEARDHPLTRGRLYFARARARSFLKTVIPVPNLAITSLAFSPDGQLLAAAAEGTGFHIWSVADGETTASRYGALTGGAIAFPTDGSCIAVGYDADNGKIEGWDLLAGRAVGFYEASLVPGERLLSDDGRFYAGVSRDGIVVWDLSETSARQPPSRLAVPAGKRVVAMACDAPSGLLAYHLTGEVGIWDLRAGRRQPLQASDLIGRAANLTCLALTSTSTGDLLAGGGYGAIPIWRSRVRSGRFVEREHLVSALDFSPDGSWLASGGRDGVILIWSMGTGIVRLRLEGHGKPVTRVAFSSDGKLLASVAAHETLRIWDLSALVAPWWARDRDYGRVFSPDGSLLATRSPSGIVTIRDTTSDGRIETLRARGVSAFRFTPGPQASPVSVFAAFSPDGLRVILAPDQGTLRLSDARGGSEIASIKVGGAKGAPCLAFAPDGRRLAWGRGQRAELLDAKTGTLQLALDMPPGAVRCISFSSAGALVAVATERAITLIDAASGEVAGRYESLYSYGAVAFSSDDSLFVYSHYSKERKRFMVRVVDLTSGSLASELEGPPSMVNNLAILDGDRLLAVSRHGGADIRVFDLRAGRELAPLIPEGETGRTTHTLEAIDGGPLLLSSCGVLSLWDAGSGLEIARFDEPDTTLVPYGVHFLRPRAVGDFAKDWMGFHPDYDRLLESREGILRRVEMELDLELRGAAVAPVSRVASTRLEYEVRESGDGVRAPEPRWEDSVRTRLETAGLEVVRVARDDDAERARIEVRNTKSLPLLELREIVEAERADESPARLSFISHTSY